MGTRDPSVAPVNADLHCVKPVIMSMTIQEFREMQRHAPHAAADVQYPIIGFSVCDFSHVLEMAATPYIKSRATDEIQKLRCSWIPSNTAIKSEYLSIKSLQSAATGNKRTNSQGTFDLSQRLEPNSYLPLPV